MLCAYSYSFFSEFFSVRFVVDEFFNVLLLISVIIIIGCLFLCFFNYDCFIIFGSVGV